MSFLPFLAARQRLTYGLLALMGPGATSVDGANHRKWAAALPLTLTYIAASSATVAARIFFINCAR